MQSTLAILPFFLIIIAIIAFIISTRQWPIMMRGAVWAGGLVLLIAAYFLIDERNLDRDLEDALGNWGLFAQMFSANGDNVARIVLSLVRVFVFLGVIVAILAVIAFSPGEAMERAIRPVMSGMIGAIVGSVFALAIVGTGFGLTHDVGAYAERVGPNTVYSGDRLLMGGDVIRLRGVRAPEPSQTCRLNASTQDCGAEAVRELRRILEGATVMCRRVDGAGQSASAERVVTCTADRGGPGFDVGARVVEAGYAAADGDTYRAEADAARRAQRGLSRWCVLRPDRWLQLNNRQKQAFEQRGEFQAAWRWDAFGQCPRRGPAPPPPREGPT